MNKSTAGDKRQSISAIKSVDYTIRFGDVTICDFTKCRFQNNKEITQKKIDYIK